MENRDDLVKFTIPQLLRWRVQQSGDKVALREKDFGRWNAYTWSDYYNHVRKAGLGLEKIGFKAGDKIAIIGDNIPELLFMAVGAQALGGDFRRPLSIQPARRDRWHPELHGRQSGIL